MAGSSVPVRKGLAMKLEIKTCGLSDEASIDVAAAAGATHLGFIHFPRSPRHVDLPRMAELVAHARGTVRSVVVTVNADDAALDRIVHEAQPDMLQLHGAEPPERVAQVRERYGLPVIKAISVSSAADLDAARAFEPVADRLLFDAGAPQPLAWAQPSPHVLPGGNGVTFDWSLLRAWTGGPFWLAGGLNAGNVVEAIERVRPRGIDLSSALESEPGVKDPARIRALFELLNASDRIGHVPVERFRGAPVPAG